MRIEVSTESQERVKVALAGAMSGVGLGELRRGSIARAACASALNWIWAR